MNVLEQVILGGGPASDVMDDVPPFVEGKVRAITPQGMTFVIPSWDDATHVFGPAPWPLQGEPEPSPVRGDRCLVVFVGDGVENPWVVGWWPA